MQIFSNNKISFPEFLNFWWQEVFTISWKFYFGDQPHVSKSVLQLTLFAETFHVFIIILIYAKILQSTEIQMLYKLLIFHEFRVASSV